MGVLDTDPTSLAQEYRRRNSGNDSDATPTPTRAPTIEYIFPVSAMLLSILLAILVWVGLAMYHIYTKRKKAKKRQQRKALAASDTEEAGGAGKSGPKPYGLEKTPDPVKRARSGGVGLLVSDAVAPPQVVQMPDTKGYELHMHTAGALTPGRTHVRPNHGYAGDMSPRRAKKGVAGDMSPRRAALGVTPEDRELGTSASSRGGIHSPPQPHDPRRRNGSGDQLDRGGYVANPNSTIQQEHQKMMIDLEQKWGKDDFNTLLASKKLAEVLTEQGKLKESPKLRKLLEVDGKPDSSGQRNPFEASVYREDEDKKTASNGSLEWAPPTKGTQLAVNAAVQSFTAAPSSVEWQPPRLAAWGPRSSTTQRTSEGDRDMVAKARSRPRADSCQSVVVD